MGFGIAFTAVSVYIWWVDFSLYGAPCQLKNANCPLGFITHVEFNAIFVGYLPNEPLVMEELQNQKPFKPVDVQELMMEKNPSLGQLIPRFVYRMIHNIMRLDFMNNFMEKHGHLEGSEFVDAVIREFEVSSEVFGLENIPVSGNYIFVSNHPLGGFDSILLMSVVHRRLGAFKFLVNDVLMKIPNLKSLFVPVNKHGGNSRESARMLASTYEAGGQILIFPSGYASRKIKGKVVDLPWQKHFVAKAVQYKRDVIPVFISGRNSNRFYRIAGLRKLLGISWNLEMFLLPDETYRHRRKKVALYFGTPIPWQTFDRSRSHLEWASQVRDLVYEFPKADFDHKK